jgi:polar amino acid transport system permease protein
MNHVMTTIVAAALGLGLNFAAYYSEIVRAGILSVDEGQSEAAVAYGLRRLQMMRYIVLPQAMRVIIPPTGNELIGMLKWTSLASVIAYTELLSQTTVIYERTFQILPMLIVASIWYLIMVTVLSVGQYFLEQRFARGAHRHTKQPAIFRYYVRLKNWLGGLRHKAAHA